MAAENFHRHLEQNPYPGDVLVIGRDETGEKQVHVYGISGQGPYSIYCVLVKDDVGRVRTQAVDPIEDPKFIAHTAMQSVVHEGQRVHVIGNGLQTDLMAECMFKDGASDIFERMSYGPAPDFTQSITAVSGWHTDETGLNGKGAIWIARKSLWGTKCDHSIHRFGAFGAGFGYGVTTNEGDGDPRPPFRGEPLPMPLKGGIEEIAKTYWDALDPENKVSLAVKFIPKEGPVQVHIINKYSKVAE